MPETPAAEVPADQWPLFDEALVARIVPAVSEQILRMHRPLNYANVATMIAGLKETAQQFRAEANRQMVAHLEAQIDGHLHRLSVQQQLDQFISDLTYELSIMLRREPAHRWPLDGPQGFRDGLVGAMFQLELKLASESPYRRLQGTRLDLCSTSTYGTIEHQLHPFRQRLSEILGL